MSQVMIASQLDEDYNDVIREREYPAAAPDQRARLHRPGHPASGLALRRTVGAPGVVRHRLLSAMAVQRPPVTTSRGSAADRGHAAYHEP